MSHKTTVTFSDGAWAALHEVTELTGAPMAQVIRQAIGMYRWYRELRARGERLVVLQRDGSMREVTFG